VNSFYAGASSITKKEAQSGKERHTGVHVLTEGGEGDRSDNKGQPGSSSPSKGGRDGKPARDNARFGGNDEIGAPGAKVRRFG